MRALLQTAEMLGLPLIEQGADGALHANGAAQAILGTELTATFEAAVAQAALCTDDDARLLRVLARARAGEAASASLEAARVVALPGSNGGICVVILATSADLERRAALVDAAAEVAHEVGNALSAITGWAEIGRSERQRERVDEALERIEQSARSAREAARGLLGAARGQGATKAHAGVTTDAAKLAVHIGRTLGPLAASRGVHLDTAVGGIAPIDDPSGRLWTVLWNLVKNAIEASPKGGLVELRVATRARGIRLTVSDNGPGMDATARERAFEPYFTTKRDGTGLGLPLVRRSLESLGGSIALEGRRGGGLRAVVSLPLASPVRAARGAPRDTGVRRRAVVPERKVLVIEDDTALRELVATTLELRGAQVTAVGSAARTRELTGPFELAIIDLTLGDGRGDHVLAELRARGVLLGPAIIATGRALPESLDARPDAVLRKPFAIDEMTELVAELTDVLHATESRRGSAR